MLRSKRPRPRSKRRNCPIVRRCRATAAFHRPRRRRRNRRGASRRLCALWPERGRDLLTRSRARPRPARHRFPKRASLTNSTGCCATRSAGSRHHHPPGRSRRPDAARSERRQARAFAEAFRRGPRRRPRTRRAGGAARLKLAVNQNGRWAPHLAYIREAVKAGLIGEVIGVHVEIRWNHRWIAGTSFEAIEDLVLWDFGVHWFDFLASVLGDRARSAMRGRSRRPQTVRPPILAQAA